MRVRHHRIGVAVVSLATAVTLGLPCAPAGATEGFISGSCLLEVQAGLSGDTLNVDSTSTLNVCVTNEGVGAVLLDAPLPGLVGFACTNGLLAGVGKGESGQLTVSAGAITVLSAENMVIAGATDGTTLDLVFAWEGSDRVVAGEGTFVLALGSSPCSTESTTSTWTGEIVFGDPVLP